MIANISFLAVTILSISAWSTEGYFNSENEVKKRQCEMGGGQWTPLDLNAESGVKIEGEGSNFSQSYYCGQRTGTPKQNANTTNQQPQRAAPTVYGRSCSVDTDEATNECKFDDSPALKTVMTLASQLKAQLNQASSSPAVLCSKMGNMAQAIDGAVAAFSGYCSTSYSKCQQSCKNDLAEAKEAKMAAERMPNPELAANIEKFIDSIKSDQKRCSSLSGNLQNVAENIGGYAQIEQMKAQTCGQLTTDQTAEMCKANPSLVICKQAANSDCSNPAFAASNPVCICQTNPSDPRCGGSSNSNGNFASSNKLNGGGGTGADGVAGDFGGFGGEFSGGISDVNAMPGKPQQGGLPPANGGSARGMGFGGGGQNGGAAPGRGGGGGGGSGASTKVIGGYGYGGGGSYGMGGGSGSNDPAAMAYRRGALGPNGKPMDLRQFMPGGKMDPSRALAGVSGPDGITGPNSNIWKKINVRYFSVSPSLLP